jgi:hypothetical protein
LPIFERHLKQAGYAYEQGPGLTSDSLHIYVQTDNITALEVVIRAANNECVEMKRAPKRPRH